MFDDNPNPPPPPIPRTAINAGAAAEPAVNTNNLNTAASATNQGNNVQPPKKGCLGCSPLVLLLISAIVACGVLLLVLLAVLGNQGSAHMAYNMNSPLKEELVREGGDNKIAIIDVEGVISSSSAAGNKSMSEQVLAKLQAAGDDPQVLGIVLRINSPGGEVTASDIIYQAVRKLAAKKPLVVFMESVAASGGYYISCASSHIIAQPTTLTGSIGVIISTYNGRQMLDKIGVQPVVFTSGDFKDMLSMTKDMSPEVRNYVQYLVDQMYEDFVSKVVNARKMDKQQLQTAKLIDGRILSGIDAKSKGLVDQLGYLDDAIEYIAAKASAGNYRVVRYQHTLGLGALFGFNSSVNQPRELQLKLALPGSQGIAIQPGMPYLLPPSMVTSAGTAGN